MKTYVPRMILGGLLAMSLVACSKSLSSWVTGASLATTTNTTNNDENVKFSVKLNTGSISLVPMSFQVFNPHDANQLLGQVDIVVPDGGQPEIALSLDLTSVLSLPDNPSVGLLPNGTAIPVTNVNANGWISLLAKSSNTKVYLNIDLAAKTAAVGVAVGLDALSIGAPADLLFPFNISNVSGEAGIYTGPNKGQSGFAVFADASKLLGSSAVVKFAEKKNRASRIEDKIQQLNDDEAVINAN